RTEQATLPRTPRIRRLRGHPDGRAPNGRANEPVTARILVLGGGFAGLWSAVGAARALDEFGIGPEAVQVTVVNRDQWPSIRVRNYEPHLNSVRGPLAELVDPIHAELVSGEVVGLDF